MCTQTADGRSRALKEPCVPRAGGQQWLRMQGSEVSLARAATRASSHEPIGRSRPYNHVMAPDSRSGRQAAPRKSSMPAPDFRLRYSNGDVPAAPGHASLPIAGARIRDDSDELLELQTSGLQVSWPRLDSPASSSTRERTERGAVVHTSPTTLQPAVTGAPADRPAFVAAVLCEAQALEDLRELQREGFSVVMP